MNFQQRRAVNPFITGKIGSVDYQTRDVYSRLHRMRNFSQQQCLAALKLDSVQDTVRKALARRLRSLGLRACRKCGCIHCDPCPGGCAWASLDLCTACDPSVRNKPKRAA